MNGTVRVFDETVWKELPERFERIVRGVAQALGCKVEIEFERFNRPTINDPAMCAHARAAARRSSAPRTSSRRAYDGRRRLLRVPLRVPGCFIAVGSRNAAKGLTYGHHHPRFDVDEGCLEIGAEIMLRTARRFLDPELAPRVRGALLSLVVASCVSAVALADWLQPDPSYRDAQFLLRAAARDTVAPRPIRRASTRSAWRCCAWRASRMPRRCSAACSSCLRVTTRPKPARQDACSPIGSARPRACCRGEDRSGSRGRPLRGAAAARRVRARGRAGRSGQRRRRIELLKLLAEHPPYQVTLAGEARLPWTAGYAIPSSA